MSELSSTGITKEPGPARRAAVSAGDEVSPIHRECAYSVVDVCRFARIGRSLAYRALSKDERYRGALPYLASFTIGGRRVIRGRVVLAWLDALEAQSADEGS